MILIRAILLTSCKISVVLTTTEFDVEKFNLRKLNDLRVRKEFQIKISDSFTALKSLSDNGDIHRTLENIKENIKPQKV